MISALLVLALAFASPLPQQHDHPAPEKLGQVNFPVSCTPAVQADFNRAVALLHSFAYQSAQQQFQVVIADDPNCAMAHWGIAMTQFHQLWEPPLDAERQAIGREEIARAQALTTKSEREAQFIGAAAILYSEKGNVPLAARLTSYEQAMALVAAQNPADTESQVFYALALLATAPPAGRTHANQKKAAAILQPLYLKNPQHPGIPHYLIHACDNSEMAQQGVAAARRYSQIAPSAPHALHMPSHIFTRLGMWNDSVQSNLAARQAAHNSSDLGEELHAMDYLTYAYLQLGRFQDAAAVISDLGRMPATEAAQFKVSYAATAMPVRYAVERGDWAGASKIQPLLGSPMQVQAVAYWGRATGFARLGKPDAASAETAKLVEIEKGLRADGKQYWADQTLIAITEAKAWQAFAAGDRNTAKATMGKAADLEDSMEKQPITPGPIVPAREQCGQLLLELGEPAASLQEFESSLKESPGRRSALVGALKASQQIHATAKIQQYETALATLSTSTP